MYRPVQSFGAIGLDRAEPPSRRGGSTMPEQATEQTAPPNGPRASRPVIEGYGIPEDEGGLLTWSAIEDKLVAARIYWVATATDDGRPHVMPIWGLWIDGALYFGTGPKTRTARNLAANPRTAVHLDSGPGGDEAVILEGSIEVLRNPDPALSQTLDDGSAAKYDWRPSQDQTEPVGEGSYVFRPRLAFAWTSFPKDATRWTFTQDRFAQD
jgi:nitroimidazol reductase NimA-like FMN-containing flavoprotein (pyridoxamine 5'-phosphate oxidase superfamily)